MDKKRIKKLKFIRIIFLIFFIGSVALLIGAVMFSYPEGMLFMLTAILAGLFLWANGRRRENTLRILFFMVIIPLIIGIFYSGNSYSELPSLALIIVQAVNAILFFMISMKKITNIPKTKRFILVMSIILIIYQIAMIFSILMQRVQLDYAVFPTGMTVLIFVLSILGGILVSLYVLFYTFIVFNCLDPVFYKKFAKEEPGTAIREAKNENDSQD